METNNKLEIRLCKFDSNEEWEQYIVLQNDVYKERHILFKRESFYKYYIENPAGRVLSFGAFDNGRMIANYTCIPKKMLIDGRVVNGLLSMATVTHPDYRGRGLFKTLAKMTYEKAKEDGYEFVVGVANANSFPGFMKYFPFTFVDKLQVKVGYGSNVQRKSDIKFSGYYDEELMKWRASWRPFYSISNSSVEGKHGRFVRTYMGTFETDALSYLSLPKSKCSLLPKLYVGIGAEVKGLYFDVPKFIKHSPFNLIFMDLTDGKLPKVTKDNICFQLWDFDVA